ncbi:MAG: GDSL-type esterase/lipase family protein [Lentisphaeraceae bacterium]|nr:GDSL-type esterase/lipase family protein [Lentisphaeraceae bacterium]
MNRIAIFIILLLVSQSLLSSMKIKLKNNNHIVLLGNGLGSRMLHFNYFETEVYRRNIGKRLFIRNMCDEGNTPAYRPHSGRSHQFAFESAEKFYPLSTSKDRWGSGQIGRGSFPSPDQWLTENKADIIIAFFGFNESFGGPKGLNKFKEELTAFVNHTKSQKYNGKSAPQLVLISPTAFQDLSKTLNTPNGAQENANLKLYSEAMKKIAESHQVAFVDLFSVTQNWYSDKTAYTRDGALLNNAGYKKLAPVLTDLIFGKGIVKGDEKEIHKAVSEKNWMWKKYYKIPNGVHVFGRRHGPYGPQNYPSELKKLKELAAVRDELIWATLVNKKFDLQKADAKTSQLPVIKTNYNPKNKKSGTKEYLSGEASLKTIKVPKGYKMELFASEKEFPNLANPCQISFDNKGRLWIAVMPVYPHYAPGDAKPADKLLILEDTNGDGKADKETVFADDLHLPLGFEFAPEGVYVSQGNDLILLKDTNGDDKADSKEIVFSGFDDHDTHHAISAFCADPSGAILMGEGTFLHSHIETAYGPIRSSNGGFFRYSPQNRRLERTARLSIPNPWGIAFDEWGQDFFLDTSDANFRWMLPGSINIPFGEFSPNPENLLERKGMVRPTSGLEFVSSRHFPENVQGDVLISNCIGFHGTKQHQIFEQGTAFKSKFRQDLIRATDRNFRPVDMEFAPDGSLYLADWHNMLIGHMQHSTRDPNRDHTHGRIYRLTYPSRPLLKPAKIAGASIEELLENLKLPEYRTRYRTRRELRGRNTDKVLKALKVWISKLNSNQDNYEHCLVEALWISWGLNKVDKVLLQNLLKAKNYKARCAAVRVLRYTDLHNKAETLKGALKDTHGRVRLEAMVATSWLPQHVALEVMKPFNPKVNIDKTSQTVYSTIMKVLSSQSLQITKKKSSTLKGHEQTFSLGRKIYRKDGHCGTCHQEDGQGLPAAHFPPLASSEWVTGSEELLIKIALHGIQGPLTVKGEKYPGMVPMAPFKHLSDRELAAVLTYIRNSFGNKASVISQSKVRKVRALTKGKTGFYTANELLQDKVKK